MCRKKEILEYGWLFTDTFLSNAECFDVDTSGWKSVSIPHDWAIERPYNKDMDDGASQGYFDRWGIGFYRYMLPLSEKKEKHRYLLTFDGIYENSTVWVNEKEVGHQLYGYSGFTLDITNDIRVGDNLIVVRADNRKGPVERWYSGAGLYRKVTFSEVYERYFDEQEILVTTEIEDDYRSSVLTVDTGMVNVAVSAVLRKGGHFVTEAKSDDGILTIRLENPDLWSAGTPHLYSLELILTENSMAVDKIELPIGIRSIVFDEGKGLLVNGLQEKLKGVCLHQDIAGVGIAVTKSLLRQRLEILKKMGCNAIRTSHNTPPPELLDVCDEMGFYLIDEAFDKWDTGAYGRYFEKEWTHDLGFMMKRDRNRACVVIWSIGNEIAEQGSLHMLDITKKMISYAKKIDSTRPITVALSPHYFDHSGTEHFGIDTILPTILEIADCVDILSLNYQEQWYEDIRALRPEKLIVGSETYVFFRGSRDHYFNFSVDNPWLDVERHEYVIGGFLWPGVDYLGECREFPCRGRFGSPISSNHERKPLSYLFESYWSEKPMVHITIQDYTLRDKGDREHWNAPRMLDCWNFPMYIRTPMPYLIFTNCDEVKLSLNDRRFDIKKPTDFSSRIITGFLPMDTGTVKVEGYIDGKKVCEHKLTTAKETAKLLFDTEKVYIKKEEVQQYLLTVRAFDRDDIPVIRESAEVKFTVEGAADIVSVDSGDVTSLEPISSDKVHLFRGSASVILRVKEKATGRIIVSAYADGILSAETEIVLL